MKKKWHCEVLKKHCKKSARYIAKQKKIYKKSIQGLKKYLFQQKHQVCSWKHLYNEKFNVLNTWLLFRVFVQRRKLKRNLLNQNVNAGVFLEKYVRKHRLESLNVKKSKVNFCSHGEPKLFTFCSLTF